MRWGGGGGGGEGGGSTGTLTGDALLQDLDGALDLPLPVLLGRVDLREPLQPHVDLGQLGRFPTVLEEGAGAEGVRVRRAEPAVRHLVLGGEGGVVVRREARPPPVARRRFGRNLLLADELGVRLAVGREADRRDAHLSSNGVRNVRLGMRGGPYRRTDATRTLHSPIATVTSSNADPRESMRSFSVRPVAGGAG